MAKSKDILSDYGRDSTNPQRPRATCGGVCEAKPLRYDPPKGPTNQMRARLGLGGTNHGSCGTQGKR